MVTAQSRVRRRMQISRKMSAHNVMASISRTLGTRHAEGKPANEVKFAGEESKDKLYEPKHKQKLVRVLTVVAYIISVSLAAIVLSLYYMYIWDPSDHRYRPHKLPNATTSMSQAGGNTAKTSCVDVTPSVIGEIAGSTNRLNGTSMDGTTPLGPPTTESPPSTYDSSPQQLIKSSLYRTLTTPASQRDVDLSTDLPLMPSISSDQFQAVPRVNNDEDYHDSTIEPGADDLMDD